MSAKGDQNVITIKNREKIYGNVIYDVFVDDICDERGNEVAGYLSVEAKNIKADLTTGVCVLPFDGSKIGLISIFRHPQSKASFEAVKGHIEANEALVTSATRELYEESGYDCDESLLSCEGFVSPEAGLFKGRTALFFANVSSVKRGAYEHEMGHAALDFFTIKQVKQMMSDSEIEDATTMVAILKMLALLPNQE